MVVTAEDRLSHIDYHFNTKAVIVPLVSSTGHGHASIKRIHYQEGQFAVGSILACIYPFNEKHINMKFLFEYLNIFKKIFFVDKMKGAANVSLKINSIKETPVPIFSKKYQDKLQKVFDLIDQIDKEISYEYEISKMMKKAILTDIL